MNFLTSDEVLLNLLIIHLSKRGLLLIGILSFLGSYLSKDAYVVKKL